MTFQRRNLLKALGLLGPAYFLPSARRHARAADPTIPTRILFFYTPHGTLFRQWIRPPAGASAPMETSFELGPILQPLQAFKSKLLLLEGLDMRSQYVDPINPTQGHIGGQTHALSAINRANANAAGGISIDQFISRGINSPAPLTAVPSLEMSARYNAGIAPYATSWTGSNALVPPMTTPASVYARLFPQGAMPSQPSADAVAAALRKKSVLDATLAEFNAIKQPLSTTDKGKLDAHAALIRDLEGRSALTGVACAPPDQASITATFKKDCPGDAGSLCIADAADAFTRLAVAAFACDITRVITLDVEQLDGSAVGVDDIHGFLHGMDDVFWYASERWGVNGGTPTAATAMDPKNIQMAIAYYALYAKMMANLLGLLDAIPEPDGSTLLDHTIVLWCGEIGSPNHRNFMMNYVIGGGGGASFKTGRYLTFPRTLPPVNDADWYPNAGVPHNNLLVSLANAMGLSNVTTFGNPDTCTGALSQLRG
jgi:hypothetical protein